MLKHLHEYLSYLVLDNVINILGSNISARSKFLSPVCVLFKIGIKTNRVHALVYQGIRKSLHFVLETCGKNGESHNLDKTDIFLFDMMKLAVGVEISQRTFFRGNIVSQHQIKLVGVSVFTCNGSYRIVGYSVCLRKYERAFVGIASPFCQYLIPQLYEPFIVGTAKSQHGHRPFHPAYVNVLESLYSIGLLNRSGSHGKIVMSPLEMLMGEDRAAHNGKIGV